MDEMKSRQETSDDGVGGVGGADIILQPCWSESRVLSWLLVVSNAEHCEGIFLC